mmetsp:Transcript_25132/g.45490  ORF Transcript_25132/g.45490 Transcript_25132/m.45490 type:complete len:281 (-) Transcript_25132:42-884(-)|eukprot:CAMPEP_0198284250 /NCGR_PEP_ID=MMETSP1449-20131203/3733_1 /TAXON_ID=420275 /ORGANISM="Attheya septentrionalis, Strain CCMP2084" /LENGTH=280 /DNA_ID=CAMNT_0043981229 /DNA_START=213 /DNA_END=1055 /DNA_ORIENTATION=+
MAPKAGKKKPDASKKNQAKKKEKLVEDKTFGLKNKKKSKVVQAQIKSVEKSIMNSGDPRQRKMEEDRRNAKAGQKMRKKALKDEQDALFGEALMAVSKKKSTNKKEGQVEAKGRDGGDEGPAKSGTSRAMKLMYQMDAQEAEAKLKEDPNYVRTLEDEIETQRQAKVAELKKSGTGTPVTEATFKVWQEKKRKRKADAARKMVETEMKKKKGGKGLSVLSGRALYEYKQDLFKDDEDQDGIIDITGIPPIVEEVEQVAEKVQSDLFLDGDDDDLDDIEDD